MTSLGSWWSTNFPSPPKPRPGGSTMSKRLSPRQPHESLRGQGMNVLSGHFRAAEGKELKSLTRHESDSLFGTSTSSIEVELGYHSDAPLILLVLASVGGAAVLIGTLSATGLALNDARPDFSNLCAIGAAPVTRRIMGAAQVMSIGVLGVVLGVVVGILPGLLAARSLTSGQGWGCPAIVDMPWTLFAVLLLGVPLLAALVSGLFIRNNSTTIRRLAEWDGQRGNRDDEERPEDEAPRQEGAFGADRGASIRARATRSAECPAGGAAFALVLSFTDNRAGN